MSSRNRKPLPGPCPSCGTGDPAPIIYGLPSSDMGEAAERGEVVLGGCVVMGDDPEWSCRRCGRRWGSPGEWGGRE